MSLLIVERLNVDLFSFPLQSRDRWDYYKEYLNCLFELLKVNKDDSSQLLEATNKTLCEVRLKIFFFL